MGEVTATGVAEYILRARGSMSAFKLQKLLYYCQAWHYTLTGKPLFAEQVEAWANGPVVPDVYARHRGSYIVEAIDEEPALMAPAAKRIVDEVLQKYGPQPGHELVHRTHSEAPWRDARGDLPDGLRSTRVIRLEEMRAYYQQFVKHDQD